MPQHKSAAKRARQNESRRALNRSHKAKMRSMVKRLQETTNRDEAAPLLNETKGYLDRLAAKRVISANRAAHTKSRLERHVNSL